MTLRNATVFAIIGTLLWTIVLTLELIRSLSGLGTGIVPLNSAVIAIIHFVAGLSLFVFFLVFHSSRS